MDQAKVRLSQKELDIVSNIDWILIKNEILNKAKQLLGNVLDLQLEWLTAKKINLPAEYGNNSPKISRGENYRGFPWLVLDHPRIFEKENIFAVRTMFWWGNFFSTTLHLSGKYKRKYASLISKSYPVLAEKGYHTTLGEDQWQHHFEEGNYVPIKDLDKEKFENMLIESRFVKLAKRIPVSNWNHAEQLLLEQFSDLMGIVAG